MLVDLSQYNDTEARQAFEYYEYLLEAAEPSLFGRIRWFIRYGQNWRQYWLQETHHWMNLK